MLGAVAGDIIGSIYEWNPTKSKDFPLFAGTSRFTDDTVMTVAVAHTILTDGDYGKALKNFGRRYPNAGYGKSFKEWLRSDSSDPYGSWGMDRQCG